MREQALLRNSTWTLFRSVLKAKCKLKCDERAAQHTHTRTFSIPIESRKATTWGFQKSQTHSTTREISTNWPFRCVSRYDIDKCFKWCQSKFLTVRPLNSSSLTGHWLNISRPHWWKVSALWLLGDMCQRANPFFESQHRAKIENLICLLHTHSLSLDRELLPHASKTRNWQISWWQRLVIDSNETDYCRPKCLTLFLLLLNRVCFFSWIHPTVQCQRPPARRMHQRVNSSSQAMATNWNTRNTSKLNFIQGFSHTPIGPTMMIHLFSSRAHIPIFRYFVQHYNFNIISYTHRYRVCFDMDTRNHITRRWRSEAQRCDVFMCDSDTCYFIFTCLIEYWTV